MGNDKGFTKLGDLINKFKTDDTDKYVSREFQKYGYELAQALGDMKHKSLYIKLAKETPRGLLERAKSFVADAQNAKNKGSLFMWRLQQLKTESKNKISHDNSSSQSEDANIEKSSKKR